MAVLHKPHDLLGKLMVFLLFHSQIDIIYGSFIIALQFLVNTLGPLEGKIVGFLFLVQFISSLKG